MATVNKHPSERHLAVKDPHTYTVHLTDTYRHDKTLYVENADTTALAQMLDAMVLHEHGKDETPDRLIEDSVEAAEHNADASSRTVS